MQIQYFSVEIETFQDFSRLFETYWDFLRLVDILVDFSIFFLISTKK